MAGVGIVPVDTPGTLLRTQQGWLGQAAVLVVGITASLQIANFTVTVLSVICLLLVPAFLLMTHRGVELIPLVLAALGWISFLASCLVNHVSALWPNAVAPAAFSLYLIGFTVLTGRVVERVMFLLTGTAIGAVGFFLFHGIELTHTGRFADLWKYGIAHSVTIIVLFVLIKARLGPLIPATALAMLGLASLGLNFRSHALVCLLAAVTLFTYHFLGSRLRRAWQFVVIMAFGLLFSYVMPVFARLGLFGSALQHKSIEQAATDLPLLMAGRTEPPMTISAIAERPLLGWGSAFNLTPELYTRAEHLAIRIGYHSSFPFDLYWRLPPSDYSAMHSILLGSWAEGGVLAVLLPAWLLFACVGLVWNNVRFGRWAPIILTLALQGIWDLLYAPWTYNMLSEYACIAILFTAVHYPRESVGGP